MKKFLVTYHSTPAAMEAWANATPEQKEAGMKPWFAWEKRMGNHLVEMGAPLMGGLRINIDGNNTPSTREITGYSIIQANDMNHAQTLLTEHPHSSPDGSMTVEVHETIAM